MQYRFREPQQIVEELNKAYDIANTGRKGPVLIESSHEYPEGRNQ